MPSEATNRKRLFLPLIFPLQIFVMIAPQTSSSKAVGAMSSMDGGMLTAYLGAFALGALVYQSYADLGLSTLITLAVGIQCFGYTCLRLQIAQKKTVAGVSGKTLVLQALSYGFRLCSTTWC